MGRDNLGVAARYNPGYTRGMKTAISIPDSIFHDADALAKRLGISRSELYARAVADLVARHNGALVTARGAPARGSAWARSGGRRAGCRSGTWRGTTTTTSGSPPWHPARRW